MKRLQQSCILVFIIAFFIAIFPIGTFAGVTSGSNKVFSDLEDVSSSNPEQTYLWTDPAPTTPYTTTLTLAPDRDTLSLTIQKVWYDKSAEEPPYPIYVSRTYKEYDDYTYSETSGELTIKTETLAEIAYDGSPYDIRITAKGWILEGAYVLSPGSVQTVLTEMEASPAHMVYPDPPATSFTTTLTPNPGFSRPASILVQRIERTLKDPPAGEGENPYENKVIETYNPGEHYTYDADTGQVEIYPAAITPIAGGDVSKAIIIFADAVRNASTFSITVTQSANGTISPGSANNLSEGSGFTFNITPDSGFRIADVLVDGTSVGNVSSYTFSNITSNHTITALFERTSGDTDPTEPTAPADPSDSSDSSEISVSSNDSDDIPRTGDNLSLFFWLLCGASAASATAIIVIRKKS